MKNLFSRAISATVALILLAAVLYFLKNDGIYFICLFVVLRASFEAARMFFSNQYPKFAKRLFVGLSTISFLLITIEKFQYAINFGMIFSFVLIASFGVIFHRAFENVDQILSYVAKNTLGIVYTSFLPATVVWMSRTEYGMQWFLTLLAVVFAGDIGAYVFGVTMGKTKIAPLLSPNKSVQGAIGGLLFSASAAAVAQQFIPQVPLAILILVGFFGGVFGQIGDFFESMIKRVSGVKDSGSIMPGHGGALDRLDGVLLAAPLFYFMATTYGS